MKSKNKKWYKQWIDWINPSGNINQFHFILKHTKQTRRKRREKRKKKEERRKKNKKEMFAYIVRQ